jgi:hypothetical protein
MTITNEQTSGDLIISDRDNQYADLPMDTFEAEMVAGDPHVIEIYEEKSPYKQELELKKLHTRQNGSPLMTRKETREMGFYELEEKYMHYKSVADQYEKLYSEFLEKYILSERDNKLLIYKQRRVNALIARTAHL